jgi:CBS domain containing-hemolysin-like protein
MSITLCVIALLVSAIYSGLETGIYATSRLRIYLDAAAGQRAAQSAQRLLGNLPLLLTVLLVAQNLANWALSLLVQVVLEQNGVGQTALMGTLLVTVVLFVFGESVPKSVFRRSRETLLYPAMPLLLGAHLLLARIVFPVAWMARKLTLMVQARMGLHRPGEGEREDLLHAGAAEGFLSQFQQRVAQGVLSMRNRTAGEEASAVSDHPHVRLGQSDVTLPQGTNEHQIVVLDRDGANVVGWVPMATLWEGRGFRPPESRDVRPVARVDASTSLDRVYSTLDRTGAPFAALVGAGEPRVLDSNHLRRRVMGTFEELPAAG